VEAIEALNDAVTNADTTVSQSVFIYLLSSILRRTENETFPQQGCQNIPSSSKTQVQKASSISLLLSNLTIVQLSCTIH